MPITNPEVCVQFLFTIIIDITVTSV